MSTFVESEVEEAALELFEGLGYALAYGPDIGPGGDSQERATYGEVVLATRLIEAVVRLNPSLPAEARDEAVRKVMREKSPLLVEENRRFHRMLVDGVPVEYRNPDGRVVGGRVALVDWDEPSANDWLVVNQFTVKQGEHHRRADVVVFVNGLPQAVIELKNAADESATFTGAFHQLQTYKAELPTLFRQNEVLVASDGLEARVGSLTADIERFMPWRTVGGEGDAPKGVPELQVVIQGLFQKKRFLRYLRNFVAFEQDGSVVRKLLAGYHQFHAVEVAIEATVRASRPDGDRKVGVVWHTQGSGKSLTMVFYAGWLSQHPDLENPTLVVLTDRNDLDHQLFGQFARCAELVRNVPEQAESREDLRQKLRSRGSGGVIFTTIQKFLPEENGASSPALSDRRNIVVIADEAHRSQYGFAARVNRETGELSYGFAKHMHDALPNASFIGFTGTPIELTDANTRAVFGDYISVYDIEQAVLDKATVPIYYESRLARLELDEEELPHLDEEFEEVTEGEEQSSREKLKAKWAALEVAVGAERRVELIARDIVQHFELRLAAMDGKGLVVCMSRRIAVELYEAIVRLRPEWRGEDDSTGSIKVVMTGAVTDPVEWRQHIRTKDGRDGIARRFKDPNDPLKLVIVRDMWLTGFDVPPLHTMYIDKPMQGHTLMQAIARVNRVFRDKPGGLVVDYLGLAEELRSALQTYTQSGGRGETAIDQGRAIEAMQEKYEVVEALFHGFDWGRFKTGTPTDRLGVVGDGAEHVLSLEDGKTRLLEAVQSLSLAFALATPSDESRAITDDVAFFQAVRAALVKKTGPSGKSPEVLDRAVRQLVSKALISDEVVDIFAVAGLERPDISILSDQFLTELRGLRRKNLAVELLQRLLDDQIKTRSKRNLVQSRLFSEMLEQTLRRYQNRSIEAAQVIEELIQLAKDFKAAQERGESLGLTDEEAAFYDALAQNESAVEAMGDEKLRVIATELLRTLRLNVTVDWTLKESVRARLRVMVRSILRKYGYPPDLQDEAVKTVLAQAELLAEEWAAA